VTTSARPPIAIGSRIDRYEIVGWLGAGGMGDVYRARDPRLEREVAIKLIPDTYATDQSRLQRFEQEARAAGQINHPNILAVFDVGVHDGAPFIVSELLDGESLRSRLARGALPPRKAIDYARQIADGLAAAHDRKIVHRDIKPDNLFVTSDGRIKILDFGIAKLTSANDDDARPTIVKTETAPGTVVGTASYMSPEQVRGETVDHRSDLFSFGTVLHEMLTGRPAFTRETGADTMAAVLKEEPLEPIAADVPPALARIVSRCLEKPRETRFQSARDLGFALEVLSGTGAASKALDVERPRWFRRRVVPWIAAGALAAGLALIVTLWAPWRPAPAPAPLRVSIELGADVSLAALNAQFGDAAIISPDGAVMAFVAQKSDEEKRQLYVRRLDQLQATPLRGTDDALAPFFSPDGQWIGFFAPRSLKKIAVTGGAPVTLADAPSPRGGAWTEDGTIVFAPDQVPGTRLLRVSSDGGKTEPLTALAEGELVHSWPQVLPGGKAVLYTSISKAAAYNDANLVVERLPGGARTIVQRGGYHGRYLPSGHLVYVHDGTLFATPFNLDRLEVTGPPVRALEGIRSNSITGGAQFTVSSNGTLLYLPGQMTGAGTPLHWMDRDGKTTPLRSTPANWMNVAFSPDGRRLAADIRDGSSDIWLLDVARDMLTRLTTDRGGAHPAWTADGRRIAFAVGGDTSAGNLYWQRADGAGEAQRLTTSPKAQRPFSWHPGGKFLAFDEETTRANVDVMILPLEGDEAAGWTPGTPTPFLHSPAMETDPMFSPDGRWLAYTSNESGTFEVYVRPFPGPGGKTQISSGGGSFPMWSRTKREIVYGADGRLMVAAFTVDGDTFSAGKPALWSEGHYLMRGASRPFDLHPDGARVALLPALQTSSGARPDKVFLFSNFFDELRRIAPATTR
jgi:serine/threonine-protein kinase